MLLCLEDILLKDKLNTWPKAKPSPGARRIQSNFFKEDIEKSLLPPLNGKAGTLFLGVVVGVVGGFQAVT